MISSFDFQQSALNPWIKTMVDRIVEGFQPIQIIGSSGLTMRG
jgi:hypothetical protein